MSLRALRASRALWRRRLEFRRKRLSYWTKKRDADKAKRWNRLVAHAHAKVERRDKQIAAKVKASKRIDGISANGVLLIARFEGFVGHIYRDAVGVETIGYGETRRDIINAYRGKTMSESTARKLLKERLDRDYMPAALALHPVTQNQADALGSIAYNCGPGCLSSTGTIGRNMLARNYAAAANGFMLWTRAGGRVLPGLVTRRQTERALFLRGL